MGTTQNINKPPRSSLSQGGLNFEITGRKSEIIHQNPSPQIQKNKKFVGIMRKNNSNNYQVKKVNIEVQAAQMGQFENVEDI